MCDELLHRLSVSGRWHKMGAASFSLCPPSFWPSSRPPTSAATHVCKSVNITANSESTCGRATGSDKSRHFTTMTLLTAYLNSRWEKELEAHSVLVMTAQLFVNAVNHGFISVGKIALLVIDECHRAVKDSPMKQSLTVLNEFSERHGADSAPRVLGLTAALFLEKCKPKDVTKNIR